MFYIFLTLLLNLNTKSILYSINCINNPKKEKKSSDPDKNVNYKKFLFRISIILYIYFGEIYFNIYTLFFSALDTQNQSTRNFILIVQLIIIYFILYIIILYLYKLCIVIICWNITVCLILYIIIYYEVIQKHRLSSFFIYSKQEILALIRSNFWHFNV